MLRRDVRMAVKNFTSESMMAIHAWFVQAFDGKPSGFLIQCTVLDPDVSHQHFAGEEVEYRGQRHIYRPLKLWFELAESVHACLHTPQTLGNGLLRLTFRRLDLGDAWHVRQGPSGESEKYGTASTFQRIHKFEDPIFCRDFTDALSFLVVKPPMNILNIGANRGDEISALLQYVGTVDGMKCVGLDHSASAIERARQRFLQQDVSFLNADLRELDHVHLGRNDLIIAMNTLHSPDLDGHGLLRRLIKHNLAPAGRLLLGFPNDRYIDHVQMYGARVKNYRVSELSVLLKDVMAYRRYLNQQGFVVKATGKNTILLAARPTPERILRLDGRR